METIDEDTKQLTVTTSSIKSMKQLETLVKLVSTYYKKYNINSIVIVFFPALSRRIAKDLAIEFNKTGKMVLFDHGFAPRGTGLYYEVVNGIFRKQGSMTNEEIKMFSNYISVSNSWISHKISEAVYDAITTGNNEYLYVVSRNKQLLLFPSGRPRTSMILFASDRRKVIRFSPKWEGKLIPIDTGNGTNYLIPVSRYAEGMSKGMYYSRHDEDEDEINTQLFYGTFYFLEEDSDVFLDVGKFEKFEIYRNKYSAFVHFKEIINELQLLKDFDLAKKEFIKEIRRTVSVYDIINNEEEDNEEKNEDEQLTDYHIEMVLNLFLGIENKDLRIDANFNYKNSKDYSSLFYSKEDVFDQILAIAGDYLGINVLIFEIVSGSTRLNPEILDTRNRKVSFDNLVWIVK